jgi:hypothetical protein
VNPIWNFIILKKIKINKKSDSPEPEGKKKKKKKPNPRPARPSHGSRWPVARCLVVGEILPARPSCGFLPSAKILLPSSFLCIVTLSCEARCRIVFCIFFSLYVRCQHVSGGRKCGLLRTDRTKDILISYSTYVRE